MQYGCNNARYDQDIQDRLVIVMEKMNMDEDMYDQILLTRYAKEMQRHVR
jgi:antitoxin component of RelBE/YafQ-DinJ toxin-antitoxin module